VDFSKEDPLPFNRRDPLHRGSLWTRVVTPDTVFYHIYWRRIAIVSAAIVVAGWLALAGGVWAFVKYQRGYAGVRYLDLVLYPWRAADYRTGLARHYFQAGRDEFDRSNFQESRALLLAGLARLPQDTAARRLVALTELHFGQIDQALKTLGDGLRFAGEDLEFLKLFFGLLLETRQEERAIEFARSVLPPVPDQVPAHQYAALQAATAHLGRGRFDEADRIVAEWHLGDSLEAQILLARCDQERGLPELALARLEGQFPRFPRSDELLLQLARLQRELGHVEEARRYAVLRQANSPASPEPRIDLLHSFRAAGDKSAEQRELGAYFDTFGSEPKALLLIAAFAVDTVQPTLAQRAHDLAREQGFPLAAFELARIQAAVAALDYRGALQFVDAVLRYQPAGTEANASLLKGLRAATLFGLGATAEARSALTLFLNGPRLRTSEALLLARQLQVLELPAEARRVVARACALDPLDQSTLTELIRLDATAGDRAALIANLPKFLRLAKPSRRVLEAALPRLDQPADAPWREQVQAALARTSVMTPP
jgi:hypothetical protein